MFYALQIQNGSYNLAGGGKTATARRCTVCYQIAPND